MYFKSYIKISCFNFIKLILLLCLIPGLSTATTWVVSSINDSGVGSLRDAINSLNGVTGAAGDTIQFNPGVDPIILLTDLPVIKKRVTITSPSAPVGGQVISGNNVARIFATNGAGVANAASLTLTNLKLTNGLARGGNGGTNGGTGGGGGLGAGGAVYMDLGQTLTLNNTIIQSCTAQGGSGVSRIRYM